MQLQSVKLPDDGGDEISCSVRVKKARYILDPVRLGWRSAQNVTRVVFFFISKLVHKAHARSVCMCPKGKCSGDCQSVRDNLAKKCMLCKPESENLEQWDQEIVAEKWSNKSVGLQNESDSWKYLGRHLLPDLKKKGKRRKIL